MTDHHAHRDGGIDHEINRRGIVEIGIALTLVTLAGFVVAWLAYRGLAHAAGAADPAPPPLAAAREQPLPPGPQLQPRPEKELARYREESQARLHGWGWVDRDANVAHVPIERAIEAVAAAAAPASADEPPAGAVESE